MKDEQILKILELPKSTHTLRTFPLNRIEGQLSLTQRKVFHDFIVPRGIRILASINEQLTNITKYEDDKVRYEEIIIFLIRVTNLSKAKEIYKTLAGKMPYPLIIIFQQDDSYSIITAEHEKASDYTLRITSMYQTEPTKHLDMYLDKIKFTHLDKENLYSFYKSIMNGLVQAETEKKYAIEDAQLNIEKLEELKRLEKEIERLIKLAKKENQMNRRIEYQMKATALKKQKTQLLEETRYE